MAKLIDADAYLKKICTYKETGCGSCKFQTVCPADMPTVEAITIDWIEDWLDKITGTRDGEDISQLPEQLKFAIQMINLMEMDWRKENESIRV